MFTHIFVNHFAKVTQLPQKILVALHYILRFSHFCFLDFNSYRTHGSPISRPLVLSLMQQQKIAWTILHIVHALLLFPFPQHARHHIQKRYIRWSNWLTLHTKYSSPYPMYSTLSYLCFLNLPSTALNIFLLCSEILLIVFGQFIMHKENPYGTQIPPIA